MKKLYITLAVLTLFCTGCRKFVEIDPPKNRVVSGIVFASNETANAAMLNVYVRMNNSNVGNSYIMSLYTGIYGEELLNHSGVNGFQQLYSNALQSMTSLTNVIWADAYKYIYLTNDVYEGCEKSQTLSSAVKKQLMAEAIFIRAFWHFYLVNLYGEVPVILSTDYTINTAKPKSSVDEIYRQLIADLNYSIANLNPDYTGADGITKSSERLRPNRYVAEALLARVMLFAKKYSEADSHASNVISNSATYTLLPLDQVFLSTSKEAIWQLQNPTASINFNTEDGQFYILTAKPTSNGNEKGSLRPAFLSIFESTDNRLSRWVGTYVDGPTAYYFPYKYKIKTGVAKTEYTMVLRLAEQYLIRAEARAYNNNLAGAIADLDVVRERAGLNLIKDINPTIQKDDLLRLIMDERQRELFTEWGHRWLDLKRTGKVDQVMTSLQTEKQMIWAPYKQFWPIPFNDTQNNPNLKQNSGYSE